jgi:hypothetical protein|tara:strand:- start:30 stop:422 length:393 start_codon:yes stop_codon:yes gene_type:complete
MAGNILDILSGLFGGGGAAGMATIPGANSNKMLGALGLGSMGATTPDIQGDYGDMYGDIGEDIPEPKPRRARPIPRLGQPQQPQQPQPYGGLEGLEGLFPPDTPFGQQGGGIGGIDQRNAIIQLLKLLGR